MPPGWKRATKSSTLTQSFSYVDKFKWKQASRSASLGKCWYCNQNPVESALQTFSTYEEKDNITVKLNCDSLSQRQIEDLIYKLKEFSDIKLKDRF